MHWFWNRNGLILESEWIDSAIEMDWSWDQNMESNWNQNGLIQESNLESNWNQSVLIPESKWIDPWNQNLESIRQFLESIQRFPGINSGWNQNQNVGRGSKWIDSSKSWNQFTESWNQFKLESESKYSGINPAGGQIDSSWIDSDSWNQSGINFCPHPLNP